MPYRTTYARKMPKIYGNLQPKKQITTAHISAWLVYLIITCGSAVIILYILFFSSLFRIKSVKVEGVIFSSRDVALASVPLGNNIWLLQSGKVAQRIMQDPSVVSVHVLRGLPGMIRVSVTEKPPALLWISGDIASLVDLQGQIFKQTSVQDFTQQNLPIVHDQQALPVVDGQLLLSPSFVQFVQQVNTNFAANLPGMPVQQMSVNRTTYALEVSLKEGPTFVFSALSPASVQVRNAARLIAGHKIASSAHVDMRVDRWAYVR